MMAKNWWDEDEVVEQDTQESESWWDTDEVAAASERALVGQTAPEPSRPENPNAGAYLGLGELPSGEQIQQASDLQRQRRVRDVESILRQPYEPDEKFSRVGSSDWLLEADMARSRSQVDSRNKFMKRYPEGDLRQVELPDGGTVTVARRDENDFYRELGLTGGLAGALGSEHVVGGTIGSFFGIPGTAIGVGVSELVQRAIEKSRGYEGDRSGGQNVLSALTEGGVAGVADLATRRLLRLARLNPAAAEQVLTMESYARLAREAEGLGIAASGIASGQVGGPFKRGIFFQVGATAGRVQRKISDQRKFLYDMFVTYSDQVPVNTLSDDALDLVLEEGRRRMSGINSIGSLTRPQAGRELREGVEVWQGGAREAVDRLYNSAIELSQDVAFDLAPAQRAATRIRQGEWGRGRPVTRETEILDASGRPVQSTDVPDIRLPEGQSRELNQVLDALDQLDSNVTTHTVGDVTTTGFEQIKRLRTRLFDLKEQPNVDPDVYRHANELWSELTDVMNAPAGEGSVAFRAAWRSASESHSEVERVLGSSYMKRILRDQSVTPEALAARYANPGHSTELTELKKILPPDSWNNFRSMMIDDLAAGKNPRAALNRLDDFLRRDSGGLRVLMSSQEEQTIRRYLLTSMQEQSTPWMSARTKAMGEADRAMDILRTSNNSQLRKLIDLSDSAGVDGIRPALRTAVYRDILDGSTVTSATHGQVVDPAKIEAGIRRWRESRKLMGVFTDQDWQVLGDVQHYAAVISESGDIGGGMMAGSLRQQALDAPFQALEGSFGKVFGRTVKPLFTNETAAFILARNATVRNYNPISYNAERRIRNMTVYATLAFRNYDIESFQVEEFLDSYNPEDEDGGQ